MLTTSRIEPPARPRRTARAAVIALAAACALCAHDAAPALAAWTDIGIASVDNARQEQADGATSAVDLSGDGRWIVFQTRATNFFADDDPDAPGTMRVGGVFRFDRQTGVVALVADGDVVDEDNAATVLQRGATGPSVSDDGRWVVFASAQRLVPQDQNDNVDVYVRDMTVAIGADRAASGAYTLVSARDGGDEPASYAPRDPPLPGRTPGSSVFVGQGISGDGRHVAFRTVEQASDLPDRPTTDMPAGNVFVRDLHAKRTVLVSRTLDGATGAGGALAPVTISRDGSTVAWVGENAPLQTPMLRGEVLDNSQRYYLWKRWDEAGAPTRRITGVADPDDPACGPGGEISSSVTAVTPCDGPLTDIDAAGVDIGGKAPALSADGWTVAFVTAAGVRPAQDADVALDAFVTSMRPGVSRKAGTRVITKGTTVPNAAVNGDIESVSISGDGRRLVMATARRQFLAPAPSLLGEVRTSPGGTELYAVDLGDGGGTRRVLLPGGADLDGTVDQNPAVSQDGRTIAFVSSATNLVRGDANELADAFAVADVDRARSDAPPVGLGRDPVAIEVSSQSDDFDVSARSRRDGTLLLRVIVPDGGALRAVARTRPVRAARGRGRGRRASRARQVATARTRANRASTVSMRLRLAARRDRVALRGGRALAVRVTVTFRPARGGSTRRMTVPARFRLAPARRSASRRGATRRGGPRRPPRRQ